VLFTITFLPNQFPILILQKFIFDFTYCKLIPNLHSIGLGNRLERGGEGENLELFGH